MKNLLPCEKCGSTDLDMPCIGGTIWVECNSCGHDTEEGSFDQFDPGSGVDLAASEAIENWNKRGVK